MHCLCRFHLLVFLWFLLSTLGEAANPAPLVGDWTYERVRCRPLSLRTVQVGGFLGRRIDANNRTSLASGLRSPIPQAFEARSRNEEPPKACHRLATDSDFYKWLEGACYAVAYDPNAGEIAEAVERYTNLLAALQEKDGYLGTRISPRAPYDQRACHDLYVAGHLFEAAVAHYKSTGTRTLLDVACRLADYYISGWKENHRVRRVERAGDAFAITAECEGKEVTLRASSVVTAMTATGTAEVLGSLGEDFACGMRDRRR